MPPRFKKLIKHFAFIRDEAINGNIELDPEMTLERQDRLTLRPDISTGLYPTTADLATKHRLTVPECAKEWLLFFADYTNKRDFNNNVVTTVQFRVSTDGATELYWDGGAWSVAGPGDWSSEQDVNDNLAALTFNRQFQVIANLETTDPNFTPELREVKLLYHSDVEFQEDYIRSLLRSLDEEVRPIGRYREVMDGVASTIDLDAIETPYNFTGINAAYNLTTDPTKLTDIFDSFDSGTNVVTLTGVPAAGDVVEVQFLWKPEVVVTTSQDYTELSKVPALVVDDFTTGESHEIHPAPAIFDKVTAQGWKLEDGEQIDISIPMRMITDKLFDQQRLADEMKRFFANTPLLLARGQDEPVRLNFVEEYDQQTFPTDDELHTGRLRAVLLKALFFPSDAKPVTGVIQFTVTGGNLQLTKP